MNRIERFLEQNYDGLLKVYIIERQKHNNDLGVLLTILDNEKDEIKKENEGGKFFSYLIVLIISLVALIILLDTLKTPIINVFPGVEIILFNLFETLKDIKLFIIDLY